MGQATLVSSAALVADSETVIPDGALVFSGNEVLACGPLAELAEQFPRAKRWDLCDLVILPGFVNAHSHLCFSHLRKQVPFEGSFAAWVTEVGDSAVYDSEEAFVAATRDGATECKQTGTAAVGEATPRWELCEPLDDSGLGGVVYLEIFSFSENTIARLERELPGLTTKNVAIGVSPHAPYTVDAETYRECAAFARSNGMRLMTHVAETTEELELLEHGTGPLAEIHSLRGVGFEGGVWRAPGMAPVAYAESLGVLGPGTLVAHANYVSAEGIRILADTGTHVVYCPGSHAFFEHTRHPVEELLEAGVNVALGTDSLASNDSLCLLGEVRRLRERHPGIQPGPALRMATENGARALGLEGRYGTLGPGKSASFAGVRPAADAELTRDAVIAAALGASVEVSVVEGEMAGTSEA